jgi:hypothetical protein
MQERDRLFLSKFSIDPEMEGDLDTYDIKDFKLGLDIYTDLDDIEIDLIDEDSWGDY